MKSWPLRSRDVQVYRFCEDLTELLIYAMVVFSPWALGTTQPWSIWVMNIAGYALGALLGVKLAIRRLKGYPAPRWGQGDGKVTGGFWLLRDDRLERALVMVTCLLLGFCLVSALNASSTYRPQEASFAYHPHIRWLPHSLDSTPTWFAFWNYLGLACSFWGIWDWLHGLTGSERRARRLPAESGSTMPVPGALRRLLWLLAINGALLGLEGIVQRLSGSGCLLFLVKPRVNQDALSQFGPYAYRANAAQYFNLLWPVCVGFWWCLQAHDRGRKPAAHLLLLCAMIMAICPIISVSRGGALITALQLAGCALIVLLVRFLKPDGAKSVSRSTIGLGLGFVLLTLAVGFWLGWEALAPRLMQLRESFAYRGQMSDVARPMAADYPLYGTGPGTFETVFQLYRLSTQTYWPAQLHNDWLETRITFGWAGCALLFLAMLTVGVRWLRPGGICGDPRLLAFSWVALAGLLTHARFDFPLQVHSILFLFLVLCAILFGFSRRV